MVDIMMGIPVETIGPLFVSTLPRSSLGRGNFYQDLIF